MHEDRLTSLYRTYGAVIFGRCRHLLNDDAEAEDATHETFLRVRRHLDRVATPREAVSFIYRVATNYCLNQLRDRKLRPRPDNDAGRAPVQGGPDAEHQLADRDLVQRLVALLPPRVRSVAWLHHVDGFDQGEVAAILGITRRTVINRLQLFSRNARKFVRRNAP
jgi:RNA polymerase sigma-70 factor (ECF subfamily)